MLFRSPDAYITGEIWWDDWQNYKMMVATPWLMGDQFDAVMNYRFARALKNFVINRKDRIGPQGFVDSLNTLFKQYPKENYYVMMNLLCSHDVERIGSQFVNPDILYDHGGNPNQDRNFDVRKPNAGEIERQKLITAMQFTMFGVPQIYYGDEVGMWGGDDPDCRKPMVWKELRYETETTHPFGNQRKPDLVKFDGELFKWYKKLVSIRNNNQVLSLGDIKFTIVDEAKGILAYSRNNDNEKIFVIVNNSPDANVIKSAGVLTEGKINYTDLISGAGIKGKEIKLKPFQVMVLKGK